MTTEQKIARRKLRLLELASDLGNVSHDRLLRLEKATAERQISLTDEQVRLLERFSPEFREPHRGAAPRRSGRRRYLLRRRAQGRRQGLPADRDRLRQSLRLGTPLCQQAAAHRRAAGQQGSNLAGPRERAPTLSVLPPRDTCA